jgi:CheY-like chemotaxis protein
VTAAVLSDLGYRILEASDGPEALRVFGDCGAHVDLVLADVVLSSSMKGNEVVERLREIKPGLKALFMSGYTENAIVHHGRLDDDVALIGKPFTSDEMARKIAEVLDVGVGTTTGQTDNIIGFSPKDRR